MKTFPLKFETIREKLKMLRLFQRILSAMWILCAIASSGALGDALFERSVITENVLTMLTVPSDAAEAAYLVAAVTLRNNNKDFAEVSALKFAWESRCASKSRGFGDVRTERHESIRFGYWDSRGVTIDVRIGPGERQTVIVKLLREANDDWTAGTRFDVAPEIVDRVDPEYSWVNLDEVGPPSLAYQELVDRQKNKANLRVIEARGPGTSPFFSVANRNDQAVERIRVCAVGFDAGGKPCRMSEYLIGRIPGKKVWRSDKTKAQLLLDISDGVTPKPDHYEATVAEIGADVARTVPPL